MAVPLLFMMTCLLFERYGVCVTVLPYIMLDSHTPPLNFVILMLVREQ